ncbi:ECM-binding protein homolog [Mycobacteroides abscessus]|nr:ECM-binding protein homolog [Mycobacteroides abscessus]
MKVLKDIVNNDVPSSENSIKYQNADDNAKANFTQAKDDAIKLLKGTDNEVGDTNDIQGAIQTLKEVINHLNGDSRLQDAKNKAIQMINKALADKINDIEATNATDQDKIDAKNKAEALANQTINNINKATTNQAVDNVENNGSQAIAQIHANEIPKAQNDAKQDINQHSQALIDAIDHNSNLSDAEKDALKA